MAYDCSCMLLLLPFVEIFDYYHINDRRGSSESGECYQRASIHKGSLLFVDLRHSGELVYGTFFRIYSMAL